jgi:hypothetical protein
VQYRDENNIQVSEILILQSKLKMLTAMAQVVRTCLASMRPLVQSPVLPKTKQTKMLTASI